MPKSVYIPKARPVKKAAFKKKVKNDRKVKVTQFATKFYAVYGEMMSKLSNE